MQEGESVPSIGEVRKICLLDCDSVVWIVTHNKKGEPEKTLEEVKQKLDSFIQDIFSKTQSTHYIIFLTLTRSFRKNYYTQYKDNRKGREKPKYFTEITNYLLEKYKAVWYNELESDDLCLITREYLNNYCERQQECKLFTSEDDPTVKSCKEKCQYPDFAFIASPDKDMLYLEGTHYNYKTGNWIDTTKEEAHKFFWTSMIVGDGSDNIKGIPKSGPKAAEVLLGLDCINYPSVVFNKYINTFGEHDGIQQFYNNYQALHILDKHQNFEEVLPEPIEINYTI